MNNKIVSRKITSAIFLSIVLVAGTITALSSSTSPFMIGAAQAYPTDENSFSVLNEWQISKVLRFANEVSIEALGDRLSSIPNSQQETFTMIEFLTDAGSTPEQVGAITEGLINSGIIDRPAQERGPLCSDGIDNNGNTLVDLNDPTDCNA